MPTRPITFPKTSEHEWTNRETNVAVVRLTEWGKPTGRFEVRIPAKNPAGWAHLGYMSSLASARELAGAAVQLIRAEVEGAYDDAVSEHIDRAARDLDEGDRPAAERDWVTFNRLQDARHAWRGGRFAMAVGLVVDAYITSQVFRARKASEQDRSGTSQPGMRCTSTAYPTTHQFEGNTDTPAPPAGPGRCGERAGHDVHRTDRVRAAETIDAARNHAGVPGVAGPLYPPGAWETTSLGLSGMGKTPDGEAMMIVSPMPRA